MSKLHLDPDSDSELMFQHNNIAITKLSTSNIKTSKYFTSFDALFSGMKTKKKVNDVTKCLN